jgi:hypothetical protein
MNSHTLVGNYFPLNIRSQLDGQEFSWYGMVLVHQ